MRAVTINFVETPISRFFRILARDEKVSWEYFLAFSAIPQAYCLTDWKTNRHRQRDIWLIDLKGGRWKAQVEEAQRKWLSHWIHHGWHHPAADLDYLSSPEPLESMLEYPAKSGQKNLQPLCLHKKEASNLFKPAESSVWI